MHYIVSLKEGVIIDPFLREKGQIPEEDYLKIAYKNSEELRIIWIKIKIFQNFLQ